MKVAFIIPFAFERFFQDVKYLHKDADKFEDEIISKRDTWHFNWCRAMQSAGMDVILYHLSLHGTKVKVYEHVTGIKIKRIPADFKGFISGEEFSFRLLKELSKDKPEIVFSVTHMLGAVIDMYDVLVLFCKLKKYTVVARNPRSDSYGYIFDIVNRKTEEYETLDKKTEKHYARRKIFLLLKVIYRKIRSSIKFSIKKISLRNTSLIIPQTQTDYSNLLKKFGIHENKLALLPKPVDLKQFNEYEKEYAAEKLQMEPSLKYILHVSNLFNTKGCEHIINLLPRLNKIYPQIKLLVSGGGPRKSKLEKISRELDVIDNVLFTGQVDHSELVFYYNLADVFVLPTEIDMEGQPNVILESIACNTPPISTNIAGPASVISKGLGLLVDKGNEDELFLEIKKVLDGDFQIDQAERKKFLKNYSFEAVGEILKDRFQNLKK
jgi:glycosyltransferase involved in cell wall biosynthesis